jgi:hypothetical protein
VSPPRVVTGIAGCYDVEAQHNFESERGVEAISTLGKVSDVMRHHHSRHIHRSHDIVVMTTSLM